MGRKEGREKDRRTKIGDRKGGRKKKVCEGDE